MITKAIIIGASTVGKTTLLKQLKAHTQLAISESDDKLISLNGGEFPKDYNYKRNVLAPKMVADVLLQKRIIFFSNVDYFTYQDLITARQRGFKLIQLILPREDMESRNNHRIKHEGYDDLTIHFDRMEAYQKNIFDKDMIDKVITTNKPVENVLQELMDYLGDS